MNASTAPSSASRSERLWTVAGALLLASAVLWALWLGWDTERTVVDGTETGPHTTAQVVGCGATVVLAAVLALLATRRRGSVPVLAVATATGFSVPWTISASMTEGDGLFVIGAFLLWTGITLGLLVVLGVVALVLSLWRRAQA